MALQEEIEKQGVWLFKYRSFLPLPILLVAIFLYLRTEIDSTTFILEKAPYETYFQMFCLCISLIGLLIRAYTVGHTPKNTSGRNTKEGQVADTLNTSGMYSVVRHPLYLGNFFMWIGPAMLTGDFWFIIAFCLSYWIYYERIMFSEEQFLRKKFGQRYLKWAKNVPAFFPAIKNFKKSDLDYSWKKVLKKEKNGLFALFLIFFLFDILGEITESEPEFNFFIITMCIGTGLSYLVLKYLKINTEVLSQKDR